MSLSPEQIEQRLEGVTGTDAGAIVGVNPWKSMHQVFLEKIGQAVPFNGNIRTKWGNLLEPVIREDYADSHNLRVEVPGTLVHPKIPWWMGSPDGIAYEWGQSDPSHGLEIKVHGRDAIISGALVYGDPGTDEIPLHELVQDAWYIGVTGLDRWDHIVFLDGAPAEYVVRRDDDLLGALREQAERFLVDHVRKRVPPPPDGTESYSKWLTSRWKKNTDDLVELKAGDAMLATFEELKRVRAALLADGALESTLEQTIKEAIGERGGFIWREVGEKKLKKITWRRNKDGVKIDWPAISAHLRETAALVVSAKGADFAAAIAAFSTEPALGLMGIGADQLVDLLTTAITALRKIADGVESTYTTIVPGNRPLLVPRSWKRDASTATEQEG